MRNYRKSRRGGKPSYKKGRKGRGKTLRRYTVQRGGGRL